MMDSTLHRWPRKPLGEVAEVVSGYAFKSGDFGDRGIPVIKIKNIRVGSVDVSEVDRVDNKFLALPDRYHVRGGDILISLTGSHISQPNSVVGRVARHSASLPNCLLNQRGGKVIVRDRNVCDVNFLYYALSESETVRAIALKAHGAANQANVSPSQVESIEIPLPPLPMQQRMAGILSVYDDLIENNTRRINILEEMAQAVYREWFVNFRFPGHEQAASNKDATGTVPEGWCLSSVGSVSLNFDSRRKPLSSIQRAERKGPYPYYGAAKVFDYIDDYIFDGVYLLVAEDGSVTTADRKPVLQLTDGKFWPNNHTHVLQGKPPVSTYYLYLSVLDIDIFGYITGAAQPKITQANLNRMPVVLPSDQLLLNFDKAVCPLFQQAAILNRKNKNLRQTRDFLLPKLISGAISIDGLETETASQSS